MINSRERGGNLETVVKSVRMSKALADDIDDHIKAMNSDSYFATTFSIFAAKAMERRLKSESIQAFIKSNGGVRVELTSEQRAAIAALSVSRGLDIVELASIAIDEGIKRLKKEEVMSDDELNSI